MKPSEYPDSPFREMFEKWEKRLDDMFDRISEQILHNSLSGSEPISEETSDETSVTCSYVHLSPQNGEDIVPPTHGGINSTLEGESFPSQSPSPETSGSLVSTPGSALFACEILPPSKAQTAFDVSGVSQSHYALVSDEPHAAKCPIKFDLTPADLHLSQSGTCSSNNSGREIGGHDDTSGLRKTLLSLAFPKHGPDITTFLRKLTSLQFVVAQNRLLLLPVSHAFVVRLAQGREAYGRLRPVRRPWLC